MSTAKKFKKQSVAACYSTKIVCYIHRLPVMWRLLEAFLTQQLLRSPGFHRAVGFVHKRLHQLRHGTPPEEMGGTKLDEPGKYSTVFKYFVEELKDQAGIKPPKKR